MGISLSLLLAAAGAVLIWAVYSRRAGWMPSRAASRSGIAMMLAPVSTRKSMRRPSMTASTLKWPLSPRGIDMLRELAGAGSGAAGSTLAADAAVPP